MVPAGETMLLLVGVVIATGGLGCGVRVLLVVEGLMVVVAAVRMLGYVAANT